MARALALSATLCCLLAAPARAACSKAGLLLFPAPGAVVPTNTQFILEGVGDTQTLVADLVARSAVALTAPGEPAIEVQVSRGWVSQENRLAVRLKPKRPLKPNTDYTLLLGPDFAGVRALNGVGGATPLRWTTGPGPDRVPPRFRSTPSVAEGFYVDVPGEGLTRQLKLRATVEDLSPTYVLITMNRVRGGQMKQVYPVPIQGGVMLVGHDGCSGTFGFDDGRTYRLDFKLYDAAGNSLGREARLELSAPRKTQ